MTERTIDLKKLKRDLSGLADPPEEKQEHRAEEHPAAPHRHSTFFSWEAHEYEYIPKSGAWFFMLAAITIGLVITAIRMNNYFFAAFLVVAGAVAAWFGRREPRMVHFSVTSDGIQFAQREYLYDDLKSFWIFNDPPLFKELSIESKKPFLPYLTAPLGDADAEKIRELLRQFLPEEKQEEPFLSILFRFLRF